MLRKAFKHAGFLCLFFLLSAVNTYPLIFSLGSGTLNYTPYPWQHDWWFNSWVIFHGAEIIQRLASGIFFLNDVFYPLGTPISLYGQAIFATCIAQPLLILFPLPVVINLLILIFLSASGYTAFLLGRHLLKKNLYGLITGCIFCSSPIMIAQAKSHVVLLTTIFAIPLYILYLLRTTENPNLKNAIMLSITAIIMATGYLYYLNMLFIFSILFLIHQLTLGKIHWPQIKFYIIASLVFLPPVVFVLSMILRGSGSSLGVTLSQVRSESVDLLALFLPDVDHTLFGSLVKETRDSFLNNQVLHSVYIGVSILFLSVIGLKSNFKSMNLWIISATTFTLLSLGPVIHFSGKAISMGLPPEAGYMPYILYYWLFKPLVISDCSMIFILAMLFWSILATSGIKACVGIARGKNKLVQLIVILSLITFDFIGIPHPMLGIPDSRAFENIIKDRDYFSVLNLPYRNDMICYLYDQCLNGKRMLNPGYPRRLDSDFLHYGDNFSAFVRLKQLNTLAAQDINHFDAEAATEFQRFFDLKYIIIHKSFLKQDESLMVCQNFIIKEFDAVTDYEDESILVLKLNAFTKTRLPQDLPRLINFDDNDRNAIFSGWSYPEKDLSGRTWRWSSGRQSVLIVKTDTLEDTLMRCTLTPFIYDPGKKQFLTVSLNGRILEKISVPEGWRTHDFHIPATSLDKGHNRFTFTYGYAYSPLEKGLSDDNRSLAVAFDAIEFIHP